MIAITSVMGINGKNRPQTGNESSVYPVRLLFQRAMFSELHNMDTEEKSIYL